jgi:hypothetical protein
LHELKFGRCLVQLALVVGLWRLPFILLQSKLQHVFSTSRCWPMARRGF